MAKRTLDFAARLRSLRTREELTQAELAARAGMAPARIGHLEQGVWTDPNWSTVVRLAQALGCATDEFRTDAP